MNAPHHNSGRDRVYRCAGCEERRNTLAAAVNYADSLHKLQRFEEAKSVLRKVTPVARRVLGDSHEYMLKVRTNYTHSIISDPGATLDDLREAVAMVEDTARIARRVFGGAHPLTGVLEYALRESRAALSARKTPSSPPPGIA